MVGTDRCARKRPEPMIDMPDTAPNRALADAVNERIAVDGKIQKAKAAAFWMGGIGLLAAGLAACALFASLGYARIRDVSTTAETLAQQIRAALVDGELKVVVDPRSKVGV